MVAFTVLSQELLCVIYFLIFHSRGDIGRLQRILGEAALSTPHSGAIFSFVLHEMECLISASLTHPVLCLCGFVRHVLSHSWKVKGIFRLKEKLRWRVQHRQTSSDIIESLFSLFLGIICNNSPLYTSVPSPLIDNGGFCLSESTLMWPCSVALAVTRGHIPAPIESMLCSWGFSDWVPPCWWSPKVSPPVDHLPTVDWWIPEVFEVTLEPSGALCKVTVVEVRCCEVSFKTAWTKYGSHTLSIFVSRNSFS